MKIIAPSIIRVHLAGGPSWLGSPSRSSRASIGEGSAAGHRMLICGMVASRELADAADAETSARDEWTEGSAPTGLAPVLVLPRRAFGQLADRVGALDEAFSDALARVARIAVAVRDAIPGLAMTVEVCGRCSANVASMKAADERKAFGSAAASVPAQVAPGEAMGAMGAQMQGRQAKHEGSAGRVGRPAMEIPAPPRPDDPRQARADKRWAKPAAEVKPGKPKSKAKAKRK